MNINQTFAEIQTLHGLIYKINKREKSAIMLLNKLHRQLFGESVAVGCDNCHIKAFRKLTQLTIQDLEIMSNRKFQLKKGILVEYPFRSGKHYVTETMTDEIAARYLYDHPHMIKQFVNAPDEYKAGISVPVPGVVKEPVIVDTEPTIMPTVPEKEVVKIKKNRKKR